ncbi:hypothetical protein LMH87_001385 [Akanthomyces muscarius]|uniref:Uncharacterized protein n=1 Tax=Akanthomyces muscarius TaxID=2231603 RepID=A0A9W8UG25_AKAMU|nr:hypothetical protein LMH87_001385 [Akanthomyces muscarius]KAJ4146826.1 hypothetical protein LMH87_001385 [Akanthomyces muscarius]
MVSKTRKRSRTIVEGERADCPFQLHNSSFPAARIKTNEKPSKNKTKPGKKNKNVNTSEEVTLLQSSLFEPTGKFRPDTTMGVYYHIEPGKDWTSMTRYHSFILNKEKYLSGEFVFVGNDNWRRPYYGKNEIIVSNHLDIINVLSIVHRAKVSQWIEADDEEIPDGLYWRQALDCGTSQLSAIALICRCRTPAHPDKTLVGCTNSDCGEWIHIGCLREDVLNRVHDRLCADQPHVAAVKMHGTGVKTVM